MIQEGEGKKVKTVVNPGTQSRTTITQRKSTKQLPSCLKKTGYKAVKEKASGLLFVHQLTMQPDRQKHMLRVPFQSYINSRPRPSLSVYHFTSFNSQTIKNHSVCIFNTAGKYNITYSIYNLDPKCHLLKRQTQYIFIYLYVSIKQNYAIWERTLNQYCMSILL